MNEYANVVQCMIDWIEDHIDEKKNWRSRDSFKAPLSPFFLYSNTMKRGTPMWDASPDFNCKILTLSMLRRTFP